MCDPDTRKFVTFSSAAIKEHGEIKFAPSDIQELLTKKGDVSEATKEDVELTDEQLQQLGEEVENSFFDEMTEFDQTNSIEDPNGVDEDVGRDVENNPDDENDDENDEVEHEEGDDEMKEETDHNETE